MQKVRATLLAQKKALVGGWAQMQGCVIHWTIFIFIKKD
jgi:hypothetical protein